MPESCMQEARAVSIRKGATGAKRMRGVVWPVSLPEALSLPDDCNAGDLAEVLEFIKVHLTHLGALLDQNLNMSTV